MGTNMVFCKWCKSWANKTGTAGMIAHNANCPVRRIRELEAERDDYKRRWKELHDVAAANATLRTHVGRLEEASKWVLNIVNGISRSGGAVDPMDDEPEAAFEALKAALAVAPDPE